MIEGVGDCWVADESQNDWITLMIMLDSFADDGDGSGDGSVLDGGCVKYSLMTLYYF